MKKKTIVVFLMATILSMGLTGCGENVIPNMTDEQLKSVGEYAAITLMKYDIYNKSRLVELPKEDIPVEKPKPAPSQEPEEPSGMRPVDDTPIVSMPEGESGNTGSMEETLELRDGITISYVGQGLCEEYPHGSETDYFVVRATEGRQLLVLRFLVENHGDVEQTVDLLSLQPVFRVTVNGDYTKKALATMLLSDLSTFKEILTPGEEREAVLVIEVEQSDISEINSIALNLKNDSKTYTIQLF